MTLWKVPTVSRAGERMIVVIGNIVPNGFVDVDDVEATPSKDTVERERQPGAHGDQRLGAVRIEGERAADVDEIKDALGQIVSVDRPRCDREPRSEDGDLVAAAGEFGGLAVHVLGDAAQLGVAVVADDRDPHLGNDAMAADLTVA